MLLNLEESNAKIFEYDICIVGSGISGSIISKEINNLNKKLRVCILERGTYKKNNLNQNDLKKLIYEKLNILGAGDNFASCILNDAIKAGTITKLSLKKAHYFATSYCLENKNI